MKRLLTIGVVLLTAAAACGKSKEEKQVEQGAQQAAKGLEQMAKSLEQMASGDAKPVPPVNFRELQGLLPDVEGWEKGKPTGEMMSMPVSFSQATVGYTKGESTIEVKIVDTGLNHLLVMPYSMFLTAGYEKQTEDGYEKSVNVAGQPGWERWSSGSKDGELNALAVKRFLVTVDGRNIEDTKVLHAVAEKIDMNRLGSLK
jgi:hypothetical protein